MKLRTRAGVIVTGLMAGALSVSALAQPASAAASHQQHTMSTSITGR
ncbi:hypothetical protein AB0F77_28890 [Streptomyces sp. NPDC026672]